MIIEILPLGDFQTNCYLIRQDENQKDCLIIDPGYDPQPLLDALAREQLRPVKILLTHGHCDHIAGVPVLQEAFENLSVAVSRSAAGMLQDPVNNLSAMLGMPMTIDGEYEFLEIGQEVIAAGVTFKILSTPGHTPGSVSFYSPDADVVFTGDALFAGSIGRTDFPYSDTSALIKSIKQELFTLPGETLVYSGHGPRTTIEMEKQTNPYCSGGFK